jgi:hypothetical protein
MDTATPYVTSQLEVNRRIAAGDRSLIVLTRIEYEETGASLRSEFSQYSVKDYILQIYCAVLEHCCCYVRVPDCITLYPWKLFFVIPFYLQSVQIRTPNCVKTYTVACRTVLSSALL